MNHSLEEIHALIDLLDDPDDTIYQSVKQRLLAIGPSVIDTLENTWEHNFNAVRQQRIENLIQEIQFNAVREKLKNWASLGGSNLLKGAIIAASYQYPNLDEESVKQELDQIKNAVWLEINDELTGLEKIRMINHIFFKKYGFKGDRDTFHHPYNSQINKVLERKKGNPLSLSVIYLIVAQSLDIPLYGVNLPQHFVLAYKDEYHVLLPEEFKSRHGVLFYVNVFSNGKVFGKSEIDEFINHLKLKKEDRFYQPCDNLSIVMRILNNLMNSYVAMNKEQRVRDVKVLIDDLKPYLD